MQKEYEAIYISPHLDDVALSCGGQIFRTTTKENKAVLVVTILAADPPPKEQISALAINMQKQWDVINKAGIIRREEDKIACKNILKADYLHLNFNEAIYRSDIITGECFYPTLDALFGKIHPNDLELFNNLEKDLAILPNTKKIFLPLGVGRHVDHTIIRLICEKYFLKNRDNKIISYYEDFPYAQRFLAVQKIIRFNPNWAYKRIKLYEDEIQARANAIASYPSQAWVIFKDYKDMEFKLRRYIRRVRGERYWLKK